MTEKTPSITKRQRFAFHELRAYYLQNKFDPTGLELLQWSAPRYPERRLDVNTFRPRLTEMAQSGVLEKSGRRKCDVSGQIVTTWKIAQCATEAA